jgi:putative ABC transport system permease protein
MTTCTLIRNNLRHYRRSHISVVLGIMLTAAVLTGALGVGDSMRGTLASNAAQRLGGTDFVMSTGERMFRDQLADDYKAYFKKSGKETPDLSPAFFLPAHGFNDHDSGPRVGGMTILGLDPSIRKFDPGWGWTGEYLQPGKVVLNKKLARRLQAGTGDTIFFRIARPNRMPGDSPLATDVDRSVSFRLEVSAILEPGQFGDLNLRMEQLPPLNAFVPLNWLQSQLELENKANTLLGHADETGEPGLSAVIADLNLPQVPVRKLEDYSLELIHRPKLNVCELRSTEIFMNGGVFHDFAMKIHEMSKTRYSEPWQTFKVFTYFVNELSSGNYSVYYSMVGGLGLNKHGLLKPGHPRLVHWPEPLPPVIEEDKIVINRWLADELNAEPGDTLTMRYFILNPANSLSEEGIKLEIAAIVPMEKAAADPTLMPLFPGLEDSEDCTDWDPGIPIDLNRIGQRDEDYWDQYRGTPKAFISYPMARKLWKNRYGNRTSFRIQLPDKDNTARTVEDIREETRHYLQSRASGLGLQFRGLKARSADARSQAIDFGGLFIGFSFFLIVSALLLTGLLFAFGIEQRTSETGILLATGLGLKKVRRICMLEGLSLVSAGSVAGALIGIFYTRGILWGLDRLWSDAVAGLSLDYHFNPNSLIAGIVLTILMATITIRIMLRLIAKQTIRNLLAGELKAPPSGSAVGKPVKTIICGYLMLAAGSAITAMGLINQSNNPGLFFGAGALLLAGALLICRVRLIRPLVQPDSQGFNPRIMARRFTSRRTGRSLATIVLLAAGSFMLIAVQGNQRDALADAGNHASGTGGFRYWAETSLPFYKNLNSSSGREHYGFDGEDFEGVELVPLRMRAGDEASCLNLNRAQQPRLFGVDPALLNQRGAFTFSSMADPFWKNKAWLMIDEVIRESADKPARIPAVGDVNTVMWALGKGVGDIIHIRNSRDQEIELEIVGMISNSILQGGLVIGETNMTRYFPGAAGYSACLIDHPDGREDFAPVFSRALEDYGLQLIPATERLNAFNAVNNTYLAVFQGLGGLGLLLGCIGLGVVVLRNVLERRRELALMRAVGFNMNRLRKMIFDEHRILLISGMLCGVLAGLVAVLPVLFTPGHLLPWKSMLVLLAAMLISGLLWIRVATSIAVRGHLLEALRDE